MNSLSNRTAIFTALSAGVIGVGALIAACGGSNSGGNNTNPGSDGSSTNSNPPNAEDGGSTVNNATPGSCATPSIAMTFSPMYSAFIPGSTAQTFQIPAVTNDGNPASWSSSDPKSVTLAADPTSGGVMITVTGTGSNGVVTIFAAEGSTCGASTLNITTNQESDWTTGQSRYNDGVGIHFGGGPPGDGGFGHHDGGGGGGFNPDGGGIFETDGGTACTNCHGPTATNGIFNDVSHTPEQTGGFSDQDLINIIVYGVVPDGGYFDPTVIDSTCTDSGATIGALSPCGATAYKRWSTLIHRWSDITADEQPGIVCYLRSLQPEPQTGTSNFGGGYQGDGGHHHHDGGGGPPPPNDSGSGGTDATAADATGD